jgi:hypothetical protein
MDKPSGEKAVTFTYDHFGRGIEKKVGIVILHGAKILAKQKKQGFGDNKI